MTKLTPKDLKDTAPDQCWNPDCANYSEERPSCCKVGFTDEECKERYQLSDYGKGVADAAYEKGQKDLAKKLSRFRLSASLTFWLQEKGLLE